MTELIPVFPGVYVYTTYNMKFFRSANEEVKTTPKRIFHREWKKINEFFDPLPPNLKENKY